MIPSGARLEGFSLHANLAVPAQARTGREHLCRSRPLAPAAVPGATHLVLPSLELSEELAVLVSMALNKRYLGGTRLATM